MARKCLLCKHYRDGFCRLHNKLIEDPHKSCSFFKPDKNKFTFAKARGHV